MHLGCLNGVAFWRVRETRRGVNWDFGFLCWREYRCIYRPGVFISFLFSLRRGSMVRRELLVMRYRNPETVSDTEEDPGLG